MTDTPDLNADVCRSEAEGLNIREQLTRIDRAIAENSKLQAEREKLIAETLKTRRDRFLTPLLFVGAIAAGLGNTVGPFIANAVVHHQAPKHQ